MSACDDTNALLRGLRMRLQHWAYAFEKLDAGPSLVAEVERQQRLIEEALVKHVQHEPTPRPPLRLEPTP